MVNIRAAVSALSAFALVSVSTNIWASAPKADVKHFTGKSYSCACDVHYKSPQKLLLLEERFNAQDPGSSASLACRVLYDFDESDKYTVATEENPFQQLHNIYVENDSVATYMPASSSRILQEDEQLHYVHFLEQSAADVDRVWDANETRAGNYVSAGNEQDARSDAGLDLLLGYQEHVTLDKDGYLTGIEDFYYAYSYVSMNRGQKDAYASFAVYKDNASENREEDENLLDFVYLCIEDDK